MTTHPVAPPAGTGSELQSHVVGHIDRSRARLDRLPGSPHVARPQLIAALPRLSEALGIVHAMTSSDHLLDLIRNTPEIDLLLRTSFGFDIGRKYCGEGLRLASGSPAGAM
ncbi:hypothetical protein [Streptomyces sp. DSM 40907]|uniref:hypothetical protein n=1 Tax=Streptomyces kutzneri TaxID=3051179 RepID=UPI0028D23CBA|nr:hypothetical protein [Streptomyces sp. DSM 40907]